MRKIKREVMKSTGGGGEIVPVQGGHILRSTGRKDRHSKIFTAQGPRDRRIRLSAHTAIQFYDVQDRLGYDRPSKAVDWLLKKAKNAIDKLEEQPPWHPNDTTMASIANSNAGSSKMALETHSESSSGYAFQILSGSSFLQPSLHTQSIPDTMKSFFPMSPGTSQMNFWDYPHDLMATTAVQTEDLCLSLHSLQDPSLSHAPPTDQTLFPAATFQANYPRLVPWSGGGNIFSSQQPFLCPSSTLPQRGSLQSSFSPSLHAWDDQTIASTENHTMQAVQYSSISSNQFAPQGLLQFQVPLQIQSEEQNGVVSNKPCSPSPKSHH